MEFILTDKELEPDLLEVINMFFPVNEEHSEKIEMNYQDVDNKICACVSISGENTLNYDESIEISEFQTKKHILKVIMYNALSKYTKVELPWGSLTGIRPTKLCYDLMSKGVKKYQLVNHLKTYYKVSEEKANLCLDIIENQQPIEQNDSLVDFYVNIPFCTTRCSYCSFISAEIGKNECLVRPYVDALIEEINYAKQIIKDKHLIVKNVYFGGGTPTSLPTSELERILEVVCFNTKEFTVEAGRPDTINKEKLDLLKKYNVSRISVNPQSFNDDVLKAIGRSHTGKDTLDAYKLARTYDFQINMDLISGLPKETLKSFKENIDICMELKPDNITVHTLALKRGSTFANENKDIFKKPLSAKMQNYANEQILKNGYKPYYLYRQKNMVGSLQNIGYCLPKTKCDFNIDSMEEKVSIMACGANAISKRIYLSENRIERYANCKDIRTYINKIEEINQKKKELFN
ncbi:MAG: coproporphyrinogen dehydrogenase HemZ [Clostridiales bacterium]|nr:coproporphyrinogen dehydrogenase HemZ [Candidatus Apopatousia equi]